MVAWGHLVAAAFALINGSLFTIVGNAVNRRRLAGEEGRANSFFAMWWYSFGGLSFVGAGFSVAGAFGYHDLPLYITLTYIVIFVLCLALWGLGYYLAFIFTGSRRWLVPLGIFYGFYFAFFVYFVIILEPVGIEVGRWQSELDFRYEPEDKSSWTPFLILFVVPPIVGALAYLSLIFRVQSAVQRFRIAMVAGSIVAWFGSSLIASAFNAQDQDWWFPVAQLISITVTLAVLIAFRTPAAIQRRLEEMDRRQVAQPEEPR